MLLPSVFNRPKTLGLEMLYAGEDLAVRRPVLDSCGISLQDEGFSRRALGLVGGR